MSATQTATRTLGWQHTLGRQQMKRLLAEKAALTPGLVMASPGSPFPWYGVPYVHGVMRPNSAYAGGAVTTDDLGLRHVAYRQQPLGFRAFQRLPGPKSILLGASTAFSMGAGHDRATIASQLGRVTGRPWFHLAMVSYVSTQELMLYHLADPQGADVVVLLSGLNTLTAALLAPETALHDIFSPNFFVVPGQPSGRGRTLMRSVASRLSRRLTLTRPLDDVERRTGLALSVMRRDLAALQAIASSRRARLIMISQPLLSSMHKPLSPEETRIAAIQDTLGAYEPFPLWGVYGGALSRLYPDYCAAIGAICRELAIAHHNLNADPAFEVSAWLFADYAHFTDQGCTVAAQRIHAIIEEIS